MEELPFGGKKCDPSEFDSTTSITTEPSLSLSLSATACTRPSHHMTRRAGPLLISDTFEYPLDYFLVPHHYRDSVQSVLIPHGE